MNAPRALVRRFTQRCSRRPLHKPNFAYYVWRYAGNGVRTYRRLTAPTLRNQSAVIADERSREGLAMGPGERFLGEAGRRAFDAGRRAR
ncbi:MAG: hypothetical protein FJW14_05375 [Acidimicrobiia bacterium]|nr:hypothetical protein [Acidimicrobiia bacterium]